MVESGAKQRPGRALTGAQGWGERLRARGRELGLNDTQVAERVGMTQRRYSSYVNETREPNFDDLMRICAALATSPDYVLGAKAIEPRDDTERRVVMALRLMAPQARHLAVAAVEGIAAADTSSGRAKLLRSSRRPV